MPVGLLPACGFHLRCARALPGAVLIVLLAAPCTPAARPDAHGDALQSALDHAEKHHYANIQVDDRISQATLENYLAALDRQRLYFTSEDAGRFREQYGDRLDDAMRTGQPDPVFEIFRLYQRRRADFLDFAQDYLNTRPRLNTSREWILDRSQAPRPANPVALRELWRDRLCHELIDLMMADRSYEAASALLRHRYQLGQLWQYAEHFALLFMDQAGLTGQAGGAGQSYAHDSDSAFLLFMDSFARSLDSNSGYSSIDSILQFVKPVVMGHAEIPVSLGIEGDYIAVRELRPKGAAPAGGGLQAGDRITGVDPYGKGEVIDVVGWSLGDVQELMLGPVGTPVVFYVLQEGEPAGSVERRMERVSEIPGWAKNLLRLTPRWLIKKMLRSVRLRAEKTMLEVRQNGQPLNVGVIRIPQFYRKCARDVRRLVEEFMAEEVDGLVVDLRNNNFGSRNEAISLAGLFVGKGPISQERGRERKVRVRSNQKKGAIWEGPLAVLVNRRSGSDSEVFAAAIQDYGRGVVAGTHTLGNGTRQGEYTIKAPFGSKSEKGTLRITTRKIYRVTGDSFHLQGVMPDVLLPAANADWPLRLGGSGNSFGNPAVEPAGRKSALTWDEIPKAGFLAEELRSLHLDTLTARHQRRELQDPDWRLMSARLALSRKLMERQTASLHLDQRRANRAAQWQEILALANEWLLEKGSAAAIEEPALGEALLQRKDWLLPGNLAPTVEDPALLRALALANGSVFVLDQDGDYRFQTYDLPLQQTAMIVADLAQLQGGAASASTASTP